MSLSKKRKIEQLAEDYVSGLISVMGERGLRFLVDKNL